MGGFGVQRESTHASREHVFVHTHLHVRNCMVGVG